MRQMASKLRTWMRRRIARPRSPLSSARRVARDVAGGGHAAGDAGHEQHQDDDDDPEQQLAHVSLDAE